MKHCFTLILALLAMAAGAQAQIVTTQPALLQEASANVVLTYHADSPMGNYGLSGLSQSEVVYAHIGVITNQSTSTSDWKYVVTPWPDSNGANAQYANTAKNRLTYIGPNTYTLTIGDIRTYFGITDPAVKVEKIALVFRDANGSRQGKTSSGGDIFVDVLPAGYQMAFHCDAASTVLHQSTRINFTAYATEASTITISVNDNQIGQAAGATEYTASYNFTSKGYYTVKATASNGTTTLSETINVSYPGNSTEAAYPGGVPKMGAVKNADGTVTFCFAAPGKTSVILVPSWDNYTVLDKNVMNYQDYNGNRYFWITVSGLDDHTWYPYYYLVDGEKSVADPYAHLVLDCYSDKWLDYESIWPDMPQYPYELFDGIMLAVYRGDIDDYNWSSFTIPAHDQLVVYELLFRDFTGTDGEANGNGTVRKAIEKIPYLKDLGVNAVELMPIMEFNGNNSWGYNTNFYMAPDKAYGSPKDYKDFIDACHRAGMAVILDIVFNQSEGLHPWYQLYPIDSNPFYNKEAPHSYSVLNDWNQGNALVQQQWTDAIVYWMEKYNVDGYRFDLVKGLGDNSSYSSGTEAYNQSRIDRMKRLHQVIKSVKPDGIHINEDLAGDREEIELGNDGMLQWANINGNSCQFTMGWSESTSNGDLTTAFLSTNDGGRPWGSTVSYAESHDEERLAYKAISFGNTGIKNNRSNTYKRLGSLAAIMLMTPGPKMIWQFGELGADQTTKKGTENNTDPKIVIWSWLENSSDARGLHDVYQDLCWIRRDNPQLFTSDATFATVGLGGPMSSNRIMCLTSGASELMVFVNANTSGANRTVGWNSTVLNASNAKLLACTPGLDPKLTGSSNSVGVTLPPHSFAVFGTSDLTGVSEATISGDKFAPIVSAENGRITVDGDYSRIAVYNVAGQQCGTSDLTPGLYIVNVDGHATKVLVK